MISVRRSVGQTGELVVMVVVTVEHSRVSSGREQVFGIRLANRVGRFEVCWHERVVRTCLQACCRVSITQTYARARIYVLLDQSARLDRTCIGRVACAAMDTAAPLRSVVSVSAGLIRAAISASVWLDHFAIFTLPLAFVSMVLEPYFHLRSDESCGLDV